MVAEIQTSGAFTVYQRNLKERIMLLIKHNEIVGELMMKVKYGGELDPVAEVEGGQT